MQEDGGAILIWQGVGRVSSKLDVSREQAHLRPHINKIIAIMLDHRKVFKVQWLIECDHWVVGIALINRLDGSLLALAAIVARCCDCDLLSRHPIDCLTELDLSSAWQSCFIEHSPRRLPLDAMHVDRTVLHSYALVAKHW